MSKQGTLVTVAENQEGKDPRIVTEEDGLPVKLLPSDPSFDEIPLTFETDVVRALNGISCQLKEMQDYFKLSPNSTSIVDSRKNIGLRLSELGEISTVDYEYSEPFAVSLDATDTPYEVVKGKTGFKFVTKGFWVIAEKTVSPSTAATVNIYEAHPADLTSNLKDIAPNISLVQNQIFPSPAPLHMKTVGGSSIVATTDDATVNLTIVGYYAPLVNGET